MYFNCSRIAGIWLSISLVIIAAHSVPASANNQTSYQVPDMLFPQFMTIEAVLQNKKQLINSLGDPEVEDEYQALKRYLSGRCVAAARTVFEQLKNSSSDTQTFLEIDQTKWFNTQLSFGVKALGPEEIPSGIRQSFINEFEENFDIFELAYSRSLKIEGLTESGFLGGDAKICILLDSVFK